MRFFVAVLLISLSFNCLSIGDGQAAPVRKPAMFTTENEADHCAGLILDLAPTTEPTWSHASQPRLEDAFASCLASYIRIPTVNPPGNEELAVVFLKRILDRLGFENKTLNLNGRSGLVAYLRAEGVTKPKKVLLYHHMDVMPVFSDLWARSDLPFSGSIEAFPGNPEGPKYIWGRGALDMKSIGLMQLFAMAFVKINHIHLQKTLVLLASPDEERGALGAKGMLHEMLAGGQLSDLTDADVLLNEGGYGVNRAGKSIVLIATEEKGGAWLRFSHSDVRTLLPLLNQELMLFENGESLGFQKEAKCRLVNFETPGQEPNLIPALAKLFISCEGVLTSANVEDAFRLPFRSRQDLQIHVNEPTAKNFSIVISLGTSGHGSLGALSALQVAARGLQNLSALPLANGKQKRPAYFQYYRTPAVEGFIEGLKQVYPITSKTGAMLRAADMFSWIAGVEQFFLKQTAASVYSERLFRSSCSWTGFTLVANKAPEAIVDCRLIHTAMGKNAPLLQANFFIEQIKQAAHDEKLSIALINGWNFTSSAGFASAFQAMENAVKREQPKAVVTPWLSPAGSDNARFRAPQTVGAAVDAIPSFGFFPINAGELTSTIHGNDERFPMSEVFGGNKIYTSAVINLAQ